MKNKIIIIGLSLVIVLSFGFVGLRLAAAGPEDNWFNLSLRSEFSRSPFFRSWLGLQWDGDAGADYLGNRYDIIVMTVYSMQGSQPEPQVLSGFVEQVEELTGKTVIVRSKPPIPHKEEVDSEDIDQAYSIDKISPWRSNAVLNVIYASRSPGEEVLLGKTHGPYAIVLYKQAVREFTEVAKETLLAYEQSTLLHEFGHQLGMPHNTEPGCLMTEHAEANHRPRRADDGIVRDFCQLELQQLELLKQLLH